MKPQGPPWLERLGHFLKILPDKLGFLQACPQAYGDVVDLSLLAPWARTYLLNQPEDIQHVLRGNPSNYHKSRLMTGKAGQQRSGRGLLTGMGGGAMAQKRLLQPILAKTIMPRLHDHIAHRTDEARASWGSEIEAGRQMNVLARKILAWSLLGEDFQPPMVAAIEVRQRHLRRIYESILPRRSSRADRHARQFIDSELHRHISARRERPSVDLLSMFLEARFSDGTALSDAQVCDEALTMTATGYDTVALALTWALYLLALHPREQARLAEEESYAELAYSESLRLYPPAWIFVRVAENEDLLPSGFRLPAGSKLFLSPWVTQRDGRYFPDPLKFRPERFATGPAGAAYFPFAAGHRICLGQGYARLVGARVLARIAGEFSWSLAEGRTIRPVPGQFLFPSGPIRLRLRKRR